MHAVFVCTLVLAAVAIATPVINPEIIEVVNSDPSSTWVAGHNSAFDHLTLEQMKRKLNLQRPHKAPLNAVGPAARAALKAEAAKLAASLPSSYSAASAYPQCGTLLSPNGIENQEQCGSCWAFSSTEVLSDEICIGGGPKVELSAQDLVSCDTGNMGCNGGNLGSAWSWLESNGVTTWTCLPYTAGNGTSGSCPSTCANGQTIQRYHAKGAKHVTSLFGRADKIAADLVAHGVAQAGFDVYEDFMSYKSGVYVHKTGALLGGHAVKIVGFGEENGVPYWEVANSWGESWGMDGFFRIKRGDNQCGFEADVWGGVWDGKPLSA